MKACIIRITVFVLFVSFYEIQAKKDNIDEIKSVEKQCQDKAGVSDEDLQKINNLESVDNLGSVKKMAQCILQDYGVMDESGEVSQDKLQELLAKDMGEEKGKEVAEKCMKKENTPEDTAHQTLLCMRQEGAISES